MKTTTRTFPQGFRVLLTLAQLLERLERGLVPMSADQHRSVVEHLSKELADTQPGDDLDALLNLFPATAELYENQQYAHAGLCRSPLDDALQAELRARDVIGQLRR